MVGSFRNIARIMLYRVEDGEPYVLIREQIKEFLKRKSGLAQLRKHKEDIEDRKSRNVSHPDLKRKLMAALGQEDDVMIPPDLYHMLVLSPPDDNMDTAFIKENLIFIGTTEWKVVFDFDSKSRICEYLDEHEKVPMKIISTPEKFDNTKSKVTVERLNNLHENIKNSVEPSWLFLNGLEKMRTESAANPRDWKRKFSPSFKECVRFFSREIPEDRAIVVFLLLSKNYDVMLEAADEFCTMFPDQFACIAENEFIGNPWKEKLLAKNCVDKEMLEAKTVIGLPWGHVHEIFQSLTDPDILMTPKLTTSFGTPVSIPDSDLKDMCDLDILALNQCDGCDLTPEELKKRQQESEESFYHGKEVSWWNFWFSGQVCQRSIHENLKQHVEEALHGRTDEDSKVAKVTLFHDRGAGGTTAAKHVLWDLKKHYRCAVVKNITIESGKPSTCDQILRFRNYKESIQKAPKPVLIMIDNADDEKVSFLLAQLDQMAKHVVRDRLERCAVVCVILMVTSRTKKKKRATESSKYEIITHHLDKRELHWFKSKREELDKKFKHHEGSKSSNPNKMISFNILRENFNPDYITQTTRELLNRIKKNEEKMFLKYLSLLNTFDLTRKDIPTAAFDRLMKTDSAMGQKQRRKAPWETTLSDNVRTLLNIDSRRAMGKIQALSIIHPLLANAMLDALCVNEKGHRQTLSAVVLEFFAQDFVCPDASNITTDMLYTIINGILVKRRRLPNWMPETNFSPLIEEIKGKESNDKAGRVLQEGFTLTGDAFVAQQVARLFIHTCSWETALKYADIAVDMKKENPCLWDTLARVYRGQVCEKLTSFDRREVEQITSDEVLETVKLSLEAIRLFRTEQAVAKEDHSALDNQIVGYFGELDAIVRLLGCLNYLQVFHQDKDKFHRFLVDPGFVPSEICHWNDVEGMNYIQKLKGLHENVMEVVAKIEDEQIQLKMETIDEYKSNEAKINASILVQLKEHIDSYYGEESDELPETIETPEDQCMFRRRRIFRLGGSSLRGIYDLRRYQNGEKQLLLILKHVEDNIYSDVPTHADDLRVRITAVLALSCIRDHYVHKFKMANMIQWCTELYNLKSSLRPVIRLEAFLFYVMFCWPRKCTGKHGLPPQEIEDAITYWRKAYYQKYPGQKISQPDQPKRRKDTTIYFLANGSNMASVIDYEQLKTDVGSGSRTKGEAFWRHSKVLKKLQRFEGTLCEDGYEVAVHVEYGQGHKDKIRIPTAYVVNDRKLWNKTVYLVIGFSWMTPKAFDISSIDPTEDPAVFTVGQDDYFPSELPTMYAQARVLTQVAYLTQVAEIDAELHQITRLKNKLRIQKRKPNKTEVRIAT